MNVSVLGCGRWGTFLAWYSCRIGHNVTLWGREGSESFATLAATGQNSYLTLDPMIRLSSDLGLAIMSAECVIISISSQELRDLARRLAPLDLSGKIVVICMKGLESDTGKRLTQVLLEEIGPCAGVAVWVGPGHVQDFVAGIPNCMVIDSDDRELTAKVAAAFGSDLIRMYLGADLIGTEIGAAAKNVIGVAAGMLDGIGYSSLKGALMARGAREISRLTVAAGGSELTAYGLSHLGDYQATLFSPYGQNRMFGEAFIVHGKFDKLAEGVATAKALMKLSQRYGSELPISGSVYKILYENKDPKEVLLSLFLRPTGSEFKVSV